MSDPPISSADEPGPGTDDAAIIVQSLAQPAVFSMLFDRHAPAIHRYAARRLGDTEADDITGETFLTAFRKRSQFDTARTDARPWLYGIAAKLIGKQRRTEFRALRALARAGGTLLADSWEDQVDDRVSAQTEQARLARALADLRSGERHVLLLIAWADLTYQEAADALGIPVGTVRSRLSRARRKIRTALGANPLLINDISQVVNHG